MLAKTLVAYAALVLYICTANEKDQFTIITYKQPFH